MSILQSYPKGTPKADDLLLGTKTPPANTNDLPITQNFSVSDVASFANSYSLGYTVYTAQLTAGAGAVPTATILQNTTGLTFTWTRIGTGQFVATVAGTPFAANKFWAMSSAKVPQVTSIVRTSTNTCRLDVIESQNGNALNSLVEGYIEIRIYA
jgi:hypothetical protein